MSNPKIAFGIASVNYERYWIGSVSSASSKVNEVVTANIEGGLLSSDPQVMPIVASGTARALVNSYTYASGVGTQGKGLYGIYDPTASAWTTPVATAVCNQTTTVPTAKVWGASNPRGAVTIGTTMYMIDYDSAAIYQYNMAGDDFSQTAVTYTYTAESSSYKTAAGNMDLYNDGSDNYLVGVFNNYQNSGWTYTYGKCEIVMVKLGTTVSTDSANVTANATGVVVDDDGYAYVTAVGGAQQANGNPNTTLQVFDISTGTPGLDATIGSSALPSGFVGDYVDVAFVNGKAYVLAAKYDTYYSQYSYQVIQTTAADLRGGGFGTGYKYITGTASPASPTFALLPDGDDLYLVTGVKVFSINTAVDIDATGALTEWCDVGDFTFVSGGRTYTGYVFNTVGLVVEKTANTRGVKAAVKAHVTKMAKRLITFEEIQHLQGKEK